MPREEIADFEVKIERADLLRDFQREKKARTVDRNPFLPRQHRTGGLELRKRGNLPAILAPIQETPFHPRKGIAPAGSQWLTAAGLHDKRHLVGQLNAITEPKIYVELRNLIRSPASNDGLHRRNIDFPIIVSRSAGIIGQIRRTALCASSAGQGKRRSEYADRMDEQRVSKIRFPHR